MPVPVFINKILGRNFSEGSEPLGTPRPHPDEIASRDGIPGIAEPVNAASFEHDQSMLHYMHFHHAERGARLVHHGIYGKIKTWVVRKQTLDLQIGVIIESVERNGVLRSEEHTSELQ